MANEYATGWTMIPNWVLLHPDLGRIDIAVYLVLAHHADNQTRECFLRAKFIMAEARISGRRHLQTALRRLAEVGAIEIVERQGFTNIYRVPRTPPSSPANPSATE